MFESSNSIIFILLLLILIYFIKKHFLLKQLEENYQNLKKGHFILTPSECEGKKDFILLENKMTKGSSLLEPKKVRRKSDTVKERKLTSSTINSYCSNKTKKKDSYPEYSVLERKKTEAEKEAEKEAEAKKTEAEKEAEAKKTEAESEAKKTEAEKEAEAENSNSNSRRNKVLDNLNLYINLRNKSMM